MCHRIAIWGKRHHFSGLWSWTNPRWRHIRWCASTSRFISASGDVSVHHLFGGGPSSSLSRYSIHQLPLYRTQFSANVQPTRSRRNSLSTVHVCAIWHHDKFNLHSSWRGNVTHIVIVDLIIVLSSHYPIFALVIYQIYVSTAVHIGHKLSQAGIIRVKRHRQANTFVTGSRGFVHPTASVTDFNTMATLR